MNLINWSDLLVLVLQFTVAYVVFSRLHNDDSHVTWIMWGALGLVVISIIIPYFVFFLMLIGAI